MFNFLNTKTTIVLLDRVLHVDQRTSDGLDLYMTWYLAPSQSVSACTFRTMGGNMCCRVSK
jgi:hypothetical protein